MRASAGAVGCGNGSRRVSRNKIPV